MRYQAPIGVFDSGVGGLSIRQAISVQLPHESIFYLADTAHCPYGPRPASEIIALTREISRFLLKQGSKLLVVACNTASAAALNTLRSEFPVPIVGLEPAIKPAAQATRRGRVGVLATAGTLQGELYRQTRQRHAEQVNVHVQVAHDLVELVEAGHLSDATAVAQLQPHLAALQSADIDQLVLGCTHYLFLQPLIETLLGPGVQVLNPAAAVARQVERQLAEHNLAAPSSPTPRHRYFATARPAALTAFVQQLGQDITVEPVTWRHQQLEFANAAD